MHRIHEHIKNSPLHFQQTQQPEHPQQPQRILQLLRTQKTIPQYLQGQGNQQPLPLHAAVVTVTSVAAASDVAAVVTPNVEYAAAVATDTSAATDYGLANLAVMSSAAVGMMLATGKVATSAGRVDDTGSDTSIFGAKRNLILLQGLVAATAATLSVFTAANVMEGTGGGMVDPLP